MIKDQQIWEFPKLGEKEGQGRHDSFQKYVKGYLPGGQGPILISQEEARTGSNELKLHQEI